MVIDSDVCLISTASVIVLWINVVVNIYNLSIVWLIDNSAIQVFLMGDDSQTKRGIILLQTIVFIWAIIIVTKQYYIFFAEKLWVFRIAFILLTIDLINIFITAFELLPYETLEEFWSIKTNQKETAAPESLYIFVAIIPPFYFALKFYTAWEIFDVGKKSDYKQNTLQDHRSIICAIEMESVPQNQQKFGQN